MVIRCGHGAGLPCSASRLEIWPALNPWSFGEPQPDECVRNLNALSTVKVCTPYFFQNFCRRIELVHSLGQNCFFIVFVDKVVSILKSAECVHCVGVRIGDIPVYKAVWQSWIIEIC